MKKLVVLCLIVLLLISLLACGESTTPEKVEKSEETVTSSTEQPKQEVF